MIQASPFIGIDFGTSKCAMAWYDPQTGQAAVLHNSQGEEETPSVVYIGGSEDRDLVGRPAVNRLEDEEKHDLTRFFLSVKRDLMHNEPARNLNGRRLSTVDIAAKILRKLREDALEWHFKSNTNIGFQQSITRAVITYPAIFDTNQKEKLTEAAMSAGFKTVALLPEPEAAALSYGHTGLRVGNRVLIYDFGGGTFDVAILRRISEASFVVDTTPEGLSNCGGDDIDRELYSYCDEIARKTLGYGITPTGAIDLKFLLLCRKRKENLSYAEESMFSYLIDTPNGAVPFQQTLDRATFEQREQIRKYIQQTIDKTQEVMKGSTARDAEIDTIVLIGGSSRIPLVRQRLKAELSMTPQAWQNQQIAVALGAAFHAQQLWSSAFQAYREALSDAWQGGLMTPAEVNTLITQANRLSLSTDEAVNIEHNFYGCPKEIIFQRQEEYRTIVREAYMDNFLSVPDLQVISTWIKEHGISSKGAEIIESQVMGYTKDYILRLQKYRADVQHAWRDRVLTKEQVNTLVAQISKPGISAQDAEMIERQVMGYSKDYILRLQQYQVAIQQAWKDKILSSSDVKALFTSIKQLSISAQDAEMIERQVMGHTQEIILKFQKYRAKVKQVWKDKFLSSADVNRLSASMKQLGINTPDAQNIEREVMGHTQATILKFQEYRAAVKKAWDDKFLSQQEITDLTALLKRLGMSTEETETIEREEIGHRIVTILRFQEYRQAVQALKDKTLTQEQVDTLATQAIKLGIISKDAESIEREEIGYTKEYMLKRQEYRQTVQKAWKDKTITKEQADTLKAQANALGINTKDGEAIEVLVIGNTVINSIRQEILEKYRTSLQAYRASDERLKIQIKVLQAYRTSLPPQEHQASLQTLQASEARLKAQLKVLDDEARQRGLIEKEIASTKREVIFNQRKAFYANPAVIIAIMVAIIVLTVIISRMFP
ncbi:MAG: hypothetical protein NVSMB27_02370 [Ktedonobacteraceae bacterium]